MTVSRNGLTIPFVLRAEVTEVILQMTKDNILENPLSMETLLM